MALLLQLIKCLLLSVLGAIVRLVIDEAELEMIVSGLLELQCQSFRPMQSSVADGCGTI